MSSSLVGATIRKSYETTLTASGGTPPYAWAIANGYLPLGLTLDEGSGKLSGVPTETGQFSFTAVVKDAAAVQQQEASQALVMSVTIQPLSIMTPALPEGAIGVPYAIQLQVAGGIPPYFWSITSGALAPGLEFDPLTGLISGTPQSTGVFSVTVQVTDSNNPPSYAFLRIGAPKAESPPAFSLLNGLPPWPPALKKRLKR